MNRSILCAVAIVVTSVAACRRGPTLSDATYRQAVTAFYVSLAAMQTSQDVLARQELERLVQLAPEEAAGWANLGLLLLRQQQLSEAGRHRRSRRAMPPSSACSR